jgi:hypothetical protein
MPDHPDRGRNNVDLFAGFPSDCHHEVSVMGTGFVGIGQVMHDVFPGQTFRQGPATALLANVAGNGNTIGRIPVPVCRLFRIVTCRMAGRLQLSLVKQAGLCNHILFAGPPITFSQQDPDVLLQPVRMALDAVTLTGQGVVTRDQRDNDISQRGRILGK